MPMLVAITVEKRTMSITPMMRNKDDFTRRSKRTHVATRITVVEIMITSKNDYLAKFHEPFTSNDLAYPYFSRPAIQ